MCNFLRIGIRILVGVGWCVNGRSFQGCSRLHRYPKFDRGEPTAAMRRPHGHPVELMHGVVHQSDVSVLEDYDPSLPTVKATTVVAGLQRAATCNATMATPSHGASTYPTYATGHAVEAAATAFPSGPSAWPLTRQVACGCRAACWGLALSAFSSSSWGTS